MVITVININHYLEFSNPSLPTGRIEIRCITDFLTMTSMGGALSSFVLRLMQL